jgi:predicted dehydrogenase
MVTVGLVGCGKVAEKHVQAYRAIGLEEVLVHDAAPERAASFAAKWGTVATTLEELLGNPRVAMLDVCVPTPSHKELIIRALEAGKHVFSEKPLCETAEDARVIYAKAEERRRMVGVGYPLRFFPALRFAKEVLDKGLLGKPHLAMLRIGGRGSAAPWKHLREGGGGATSEMLVHMLDLAVWLFGPLRQAQVLYHDVLLPRRQIGGHLVDADAEDVILVRLVGDGITVLCQSDLCTPSYMHTLEVQGENGSLFTSLLDYLPTVLFSKQPVGDHPAGFTHRRFPPCNAFVSELQEFIGRVSRPGGWNDTVNSLNVVRLFEDVRAQVNGRAPR